MKGLPIDRCRSLFFPFYLTLLSVLFVLPAAELQCTSLVSLCLYIAPSPPVCRCSRAPSQSGKRRATDEAPGLSAVLEGINHYSVSALMRIQRCLLEIEPSGVSYPSFTDSSPGQDTEPGIKACLVPIPALRCERSWVHGSSYLTHLAHLGKLQCTIWKLCAHWIWNKCVKMSTIENKTDSIRT